MRRIGQEMSKLINQPQATYFRSLKVQSVGQAGSGQLLPSPPLNPVYQVGVLEVLIYANACRRLIVSIG